MNRKILLSIIALTVLLGSMAYASVVPSLEIIVEKDNEPLVNATIELWQNNTLAYRGVTDANGTVTLANVTIGNYTLYIYYKGHAYKRSIEITSNTTKITIDINHMDEITSRLTSLYDQHKYIVISGIIVFFIIILLLALAFSGRKIPRRR